MRTEDLIRMMDRINNGSWFKTTWISDVPVNAATKKKGIKILKTTEAQCRKGITYKNQKSVQAKVEAGHVLTGELPWGSWKKDHEGLLIEHKGSDYVRLYLGPNMPKSTYTVITQGENGSTEAKMSKAEIIANGYVTNSWATKKSEKPDALTVKVDNIFSIKGEIE